MVDSRAKGRTAELKIRDEFRRLTKLPWERIPSSGALDAKHGLKGDIYVPKYNNRFCIEVKHYKDDHLTSKLLTSKNSQLLEWWQQAVSQAAKVDKDPLLIFKFDRSKIFVACEYVTISEFYNDNFNKQIIININNYNLVVCLLEDFCKVFDTKDCWIE